MPTPAEVKPANPTLTARIRKSFPTPEREFSLDVEFSATPGFTILFGASGSGKTTLLDCVAGLATPDAGRIAVGERVWFDEKTDAGAGTNILVSKRRVGYVLQDLALFPHLTVEQNTEYGLAHLPGSARRQRAAAMLQEFRIDHLRQQRPAKISGGERQRMALARALVTDPCVLLLDEPLAALDAATKSKILDDLRRWNQAHGIPILYVTHSREEVIALGERVLVMEQGRIIAQGTPHEVLRAPLQETVAQLAGFENIFDATVWLIHEDRGTITCRLPGPAGKFVLLETPLIRADLGSWLRVGIRAGDILLAIAKPVGLSARNVIAGQVLRLDRRDMMISARVDCGVEMEVYLTLAARDALELAEGREVWLVIKTHSCHLMQR
ncbi:MAG TPA: ATP-binding cassette domain-containing protein [Candidatus Dormibacteraeota bacterium]|jgi:molybdate transport system ATP-binding protein|nr:ATP-binding cassette domain-containing protein [Candidatus Dormibacteraeota bacterium]